VIDKIEVPRETLELFRKTEPLFAEFLLETGRVIVADIPAEPMGNIHGRARV